MILYGMNNDVQKILCGPEKVHPVEMQEEVVAFCHAKRHTKTKGADRNTMGQTKQAKGLASLSRATNTLSTMLAQQVRELNDR